MPAPPLTTYPPEVLSRCFSYLHARKLLQCRELCRYILQIIDSDTSLKYYIELFRAGMEDNPNAFMKMPSAQRLQSLLSFVKKRDSLTLAWSTRAQQLDHRPNDQETIMVYSSKTFVNAEEDFRVFHCTQIFDNGMKSSRQWSLTVPMVVQAPSGYTVDVKQNLLIVTDFRDGMHVNFRDSRFLHVLSLENGQPHPDAARPSFVIGPDTSPSYTRTPTIEILNDLVTLYVPLSRFGLADVDVYNWKTGEMIMIFGFGSNLACTFLDSDHILRCTMEEDTSNESHISLRVHRLSDRKEVLVLPFPKIRQVAATATFASFSNGHANIHRLRGQNRPFQTSDNGSIIVLEVVHLGYTIPQWGFATVFRHSDILDMVRRSKASGSEEPTEVEWGTFPQSTVMYTPAMPLVRGLAHGRRLMLVNRASQRIEVYDFMRLSSKEMVVPLDEPSIVPWTVPVTTIPRPRPVQDLEVQVNQISHLVIDEDLLGVGYGHRFVKFRGVPTMPS